MKKLTDKKRNQLSLAIGMLITSGYGMAYQDEGFGAVTKLSPQASYDSDVQILASEKGVDEAAIRKLLAYQKKFEQLVSDVHKKHPNKIARMWLEGDYEQQGHIEFVGDVPEFKSAIDVDVFGGAKFSLQEQQDRAVHLTKLMKANKHTNFLTYFDQTTGLIKLEMKVADASKAMKTNALERVLMTSIDLDEDSKSLDYLKLSVNDIDYDVVEGEGEIYDFKFVRGGEWMIDDGVKECTSGWTVSGPNGDGVITAAHCSGLNRISNGVGAAYTTWRSQELGNGDVEYHTTSLTEVAEYHARENEKRDVTGIKPTLLMFPGLSVCRYGRFSNTRTCNHTVIANIVTFVPYEGGYSLTNMAIVSGVGSLPGDSGGPWSWGTVAWGVTSGDNGYFSAFTPVELAQSELNVTIKTQ